MDYETLKGYISFMLIVAAFGLLACCFVLYLTLKNWRSFRKGGASNITILFVVLSDTLTNIVTGVSMVVYMLFGRNLENQDPLCQYFGFIGSIGHGCSLVALFLCSYERYEQILNGKSLGLKKIIGIYCGLLVIGVIALVLPFLTGFGYAPGASHLWCSPMQYPPHTTSFTRWNYFLVSGILMAIIITCVTMIGIYNLQIIWFIKKTNAAVNEYDNSHPGQTTDRRPSNISQTKMGAKVNVYKKIVILTVSSMVFWTPQVILFILEGFFDIRAPPTVEAIIYSVQSFNPTLNSLLILYHVNHYNTWAKETLKNLTNYFSR